MTVVTLVLENVQVIKEDDQAKFAVIPYGDYLELKTLLSDPEKMTDYLDYLHMQQIKTQSQSRLSLSQVKATLG